MPALFSISVPSFKYAHILKEPNKLREEGNIEKRLYYKLKPKGSQTVRLYGLAKFHEMTIPTRPILTMHMVL